MTFLDQWGTWSWISYQLLVDVALWLQPFWGWDFCPWPSSCLHASERSWFTFREFGCSFLQWKHRSPRSTSPKNLWCDSVIHLNFAQIWYEETGIVFWYDLFSCKVVWISKFCGGSPRCVPYLPDLAIGPIPNLEAMPRCGMPFKAPSPPEAAGSMQHMCLKSWRCQSEDLFFCGCFGVFFGFVLVKRFRMQENLQRPTIIARVTRCSQMWWTIWPLWMLV